MAYLFRPKVRWLVALVLGIVTFAALSRAIDLDSSILAAWDVAAGSWLALTAAVMARSNAVETLTESQQAEPSSLTMLVVAIATSLIALWGAVVLASRTGDRTTVEQLVHVAIGVLAVLLAWLMVHTQFALHYARIYYDEVTASVTDASSNTGAYAPFRKGLAFPDAEIVDYWDFIYYSFTIAMGYQTSDVTVTTPGMRRLTISHSVIAFLFVTVQIAFLVNVLGGLWQ